MALQVSPVASYLSRQQFPVWPITEERGSWSTHCAHLSSYRDPVWGHGVCGLCHCAVRKLQTPGGESSHRCCLSRNTCLEAQKPFLPPACSGALKYCFSPPCQDNNDMKAVWPRPGPMGWELLALCFWVLSHGWDPALLHAGPMRRPDSSLPTGTGEADLLGSWRGFVADALPMTGAIDFGICSAGRHNQSPSFCVLYPCFLIAKGFKFKVFLPVSWCLHFCGMAALSWSGLGGRFQPVCFGGCAVKEIWEKSLNSSLIPQCISGIHPWHQ